MRWDPRQYSAFSDERARPAWDLLGRVPLHEAFSVADLGCGTGAQLVAMALRWPEARLTGVDSSAEMLAKARETIAADLAPSDAARIELVQADVAAWRPVAPLDLVYSNAALQWLDGHAGLIPHLMAMLRPGGVLAVQMPRNHREPSHAECADLVASPEWRDTLLPHLRPDPVSPPSFYDDLLAPLSESVEVWETIYHHHLRGDDPVVAWVSGTALRPFLAALPDAAARAAFTAAYAARMRAAYPRRADGVTVFPFRRLFFVAVKR